MSPDHLRIFTWAGFVVGLAGFVLSIVSGGNRDTELYIFPSAILLGTVLIAFSLPRK